MELSKRDLEEIKDHIDHLFMKERENPQSETISRLIYDLTNRIKENDQRLTQLTNAVIGVDGKNPITGELSMLSKNNEMYDFFRTVKGGRMMLVATASIIGASGIIIAFFKKLL